MACSRTRKEAKAGAEVKSKAEGCRLRGAFIKTLPFIPSEIQGPGEFSFLFFFNPKLSHIYLLFLKAKYFLIGIWLIFKVLLVSAVQKSESVILTHTPTLF